MPTNVDGNLIRHVPFPELRVFHACSYITIDPLTRCAFYDVELIESDHRRSVVSAKLGYGPEASAESYVDDFEFDRCGLFRLVLYHGDIWLSGATPF